MVKIIYLSGVRHMMMTIGGSVGAHGYADIIAPAPYYQAKNFKDMGDEKLTRKRCR